MALNKYSTLVLPLFLLPLYLLAQQHNLPLNRIWGLDKDRIINRLDTDAVFTAIKPLRAQQIDTSAIRFKTAPSTSLFLRKLKDESLLIVKDTTPNFRLTIDPVFNFQFGKDFNDVASEKLYTNTRGFLIRGGIGKNFAFQTDFYENQSTFPAYVDDFVNKYEVVPGQGRWKKFKTNGYDYGMASGYVSYSPNKHFNFQLGHGKHVVGDGYRSLLLSDNSFNYPFLRITTTFGKFQYTNLYLSLINLNAGGVITPPNTERLFQKKAANFQLLTINLHKRFQVGLFQGLICQAPDNKNKQQIGFSFYNPVLFTSAIQYGLNATNNVVLGATLKFKISDALAAYGQFMADAVAKMGTVSNKTGFQMGVKYFDAFTIKNLHLQVEYNQASPYAYAHKKPAQSYSHYNQALAHPYGANFSEAIAIINYRYRKFFIEAKNNFATLGLDSLNKNYGNTIFNSDNNAVFGINSTTNKQGQGIATSIRITDFKIGYLINASTNWCVMLGVTKRTAINSLLSYDSNFVYFCMQTSLTNMFDF